MSTVGIHPPKTPVTKGSMGIAKATLPNVCKMPGPPAPFVPAPLPNIAKSGSSPKDYSTSVKIDGNTVAIRGAMFESMGDVASKGTGGGLISANTHGPAKFITPGSMTVKIEGKSVHLLGEPMLNNCGPSGSPPNTGATLAGLDQISVPKSPPAHWDCDDLKGAIDKLVNAETKQEGKGTQGVKKRFDQQIHGAHPPGTDSWNNHDDQIKGLQNKLIRYMERYVAKGCGELPPDSMEYATRPRPTAADHRPP